MTARWLCPSVGKVRERGEPSDEFIGCFVKEQLPKRAARKVYSDYSCVTGYEWGPKVDGQGMNFQIGALFRR